MSSEPLKNKPLVEAIFEVRWVNTSASNSGIDLAGIPQGLLTLPTGMNPSGQVDPSFQLTLARMYDRLQADYPTYETLPSGFVPEGILSNVVQHRFRHMDRWPLVQLGPGILTVNDTEKYTWNDFHPRCMKVFQTLAKSHPRWQDIQISGLTLRYLDALEIDYPTTDICNYLRTMMGVSFGLPDGMFEKTSVKQAPTSFRWTSSFKCEKPAGTVTLGFSTGQKNGKNAIILELVFQSTEGDLPDLPHALEAWLQDAHRIADDWFFKLIEGGTGELKRRFKGDV